MIVAGLYLVNSWVPTIARLTQRELVDRMGFVAAVLVIEGLPSQEAQTKVDAVFEGLERDGAGASLPFLKALSTLRGNAPQDADVQAVDRLRLAAIGVAAAPHDGLEAARAVQSFARALDDLPPRLARSPESAALLSAGKAGFWDRLRMDAWRMDGPTIHTPTVDVATLRGDAAKFRDWGQTYRQVGVRPASFQGRLVPGSVWWRPWSLLRFYDGKQVELCERIPLAVGTLLAAASLLVRFLGATVRTSVGDSPLWVGLSPPHWRRALVPGWAAFLIAAEVALDRPETRVEWGAHLLAMGIAGVAIGQIFAVLIPLARRDARLAGPVAAAGRDATERIFRPFIMGACAFAVACLWGSLFSVQYLLPSGHPLMLLRGVLQIVVILAALLLTGRVLRNIARLTRGISHHPTAPTLYLPKMWDALLTATLIAVLPLPTLVQTLTSAW